MNPYSMFGPPVLGFPAYGPPPPGVYHSPPPGVYHPSYGGSSGSQPNRPAAEQHRRPTNSSDEYESTPSEDSLTGDDCEVRACAGCGRDKFQSEFSSNQWRKGPGARCAPCVANKVYAGSGDPPSSKKQKRLHELKDVTPSIPSTEFEITWEIENLKQLQAKERHEDYGSRWRHGKPLQLRFSAAGGQIIEVQLRLVLEVIQHDEDDDDWGLGLFLERLSQRSFELRGLTFEVIHPSGFSKKKETIIQSWRNPFCNRGMCGSDNFLYRFNFDATGVRRAGDGGLILRARAEIMKKGWVPRPPGLHQDHKFEKNDESASCPILGQRVLAMFENSEFTDVSLVCQKEQTFKCHKGILSTWSPVFKAMFSHPDMTESQTNEVLIEDIKPHAMETLIKFMYSGQLQCEARGHMDVLAAACKYGVGQVKKQLVPSLITCLEDSPSIVAQVLEFTDIYEDLDCLRYAALQTLAANKDDVTSAADWDSLCEHSPQLALRALNEARKFEKKDSVVTCECWAEG